MSVVKRIQSMLETMTKTAAKSPALAAQTLPALYDAKRVLTWKRYRPAYSHAGERRYQRMRGW